MATRLDSQLEEPLALVLLRGDVWSGHLRCAGDRVATFPDSASPRGHSGIATVFVPLLGPLGLTRCDAGAGMAGIAPGSVEVRRELDNLYPLPARVHRFGPSHLQPIGGTLRRHRL